MGAGCSPSCCSLDRCRVCVWLLLLAPVWAVQSCRSSDAVGLSVSVAATPQTGASCSGSCSSLGQSELHMRLLLLVQWLSACVAAAPRMGAGRSSSYCSLDRCRCLMLLGPVWTVQGCCFSYVGVLLVWLLLLRLGEAARAATAP
uniref:Uncharacterized protein n=1 Tax=Myotis myotis TaxID=51298 RepID=A0A7J7YDU8_MYOMY|nr:hypothetical protein mMyoMyo1_011090 [Myotis myotis]